MEIKNIKEKEAKKKACPYDGKPCGTIDCMAWIISEANQEYGNCARIHKK